MTKQEAINELTRAAELCPTTPLAEACRMAAEALRCDGEKPDCGNCRHADRMPTVDAVPVIRCKNCKYWRRDTDHTCKEHSLVSPMLADGFCSRGERKDGDHHN